MSPTSLSSTSLPSSSNTNVPTQSPVAGGIRVPATPFSVVYTVGSGAAAPTASDFDEAAAVTLNYLETYFKDQFEFNTETTLTDLTGLLNGTDIDLKEASYDVAVLFAESSTFVPKTADIDVLMIAAFQQPFVKDLLAALASELPASNPFSTTSKVTYNKTSKRRRRRRYLMQQSSSRQHRADVTAQYHVVAKARSAGY